MNRLGIIALLLVLVLAHNAAAQEDNLMLRSAAPAETFEEAVSGIAKDKENDMAVFSLNGEDILSWEESGAGKYIYFTITDNKNEELAEITRQNIGKPMRLNLGDNFVMIPEITEALHQKNGFVLQLEKDRRTEFMHSMLDWSKKAPNTTTINISPAVVNVPEVPKPPGNSGTADSAGEGGL